GAGADPGRTVCGKVDLLAYRPGDRREPGDGRRRARQRHDRVHRQPEGRPGRERGARRAEPHPVRVERPVLAVLLRRDRFRRCVLVPRRPHRRTLHGPGRGRRVRHRRHRDRRADRDHVHAAHVLGVRVATGRRFPGGRPGRNYVPGGVIRAYAGDGPAARGRRLATALALLAAAACAAGQQCTQEAEPNDTPALANLLSGDGPDAVAAAADGVLGSLCLVGERGGGVQDAFLWVVDDAAGAHEWTSEVEGPRGGLTQVDVFEVELAENGVDVTRADNLFRFGSVDGRSATSEPFLLGPGRYVVGVSGAQSSGQYVAHLRP